MNESLAIADRIESAALRLLGQQSTCHTIVQWCEEYRRQANDIMSGRGIALPSFAIVGAKGQGKTWWRGKCFSTNASRNPCRAVC